MGATSRRSPRGVSVGSRTPSRTTGKGITSLRSSISTRRKSKRSSAFSRFPTPSFVIYWFDKMRGNHEPEQSDAHRPADPRSRNALYAERVPGNELLAGDQPL